MNKPEIIEKLLDMGITSDNVYPKSSFPYGRQIVVGLYEREMKSDFYFFNKYDGKIYLFNKPEDIRDYDVDSKSEKRMVPLEDCKLIWEDKPYVELPDVPFSNMTLRQYAAIHLGVSDSGLPWLDEMIKQSRKNNTVSL